MSNFQTNRAKRIKNEFFFGGRWCFLGIFGDNKGQNLNIFLKVRKVNSWRGGRLPAFIVPTGAGFRGSGPAGRLAQVLSWRVPCLLSAFLLCPRCVACKYGSISHFKGIFRGFFLLDVCLYYFDALRGLWGFCARE